MSDFVWPPSEGYFLYRALLERLPNGRWKRGPALPVCIWYGTPVDPLDPNIELDRPDTWNALLDGRWIDIETVWPFVAGEKITQAQYMEMRRDNGNE